MNISALSLNTNILSLGSLLGTNGSQDLINNINARCGGSSFFGSMNDPFRSNFQSFMTQVIQPIRQAELVLQQASAVLTNPDKYRPIDSIQELEKGIPPCMQLGIVYYQPIRQMLEEERIEGFGIKPDTLVDYDPYETVLSSGYVGDLHSSVLGKNGEYTVTWKETSIDPVMSQTDKDALRATRQFIDEFLENELTKMSDFTSYPDLHA